MLQVTPTNVSMYVNVQKIALFALLNFLLTKICNKIAFTHKVQAILKHKCSFILFDKI